MQFEFYVSTKQRQECISISDKVNDLISQSKTETGICTVFVHHSTAAISVIESADPNIGKDLFEALNNAFPQHNGYKHDRVDNNAQSHILATVIGMSEAFPVREGKLDLGTWQDVILVELDGPRERKITVSVVKDDE
ncbi:MAG: secondary thiamine-phosphate synthase enzyme YjbQ [Candidatus Woesearchaeota archaeon]